MPASAIKPGVFLRSKKNPKFFRLVGDCVGSLGYHQLYEYWEFIPGFGMGRSECSDTQLNRWGDPVSEKTAREANPEINIHFPPLEETE